MIIDNPRTPDEVRNILGLLEKEAHTNDPVRRRQLSIELESLAEDMVGHFSPSDMKLKEHIQTLLKGFR